MEEIIFSSHRACYLLIFTYHKNKTKAQNEITNYSVGDFKFNIQRSILSETKLKLKKLRNKLFFNFLPSQDLPLALSSDKRLPGPS